MKRKTKIYESLREKIKGNEEHLVLPDRGSVSMIVPMSLAELVQVAVEGDVIKPSKKGFFYYFPVRSVMKCAGNDVLMQEFMRAGIDFEMLGYKRGDISREMLKIGAEMKMDETVKEAREIARQFYRANSAFSYIDQALGGVDLRFLHVNIMGRDEDELLNFYMKNRKDPIMEPLIQKAKERGYQHRDLKKIFAKAGEVQPVLVGVKVQGQRALAETMIQVMYEIADRYAHDNHTRIWEIQNHTGVHKACSSVFSRDLMMKTLYVPGKYEKEFIEGLKN